MIKKDQLSIVSISSWTALCSGSSAGFSVSWHGIGTLTTAVAFTEEGKKRIFFFYSCDKAKCSQSWKLSICCLLHSCYCFAAKEAIYSDNGIGTIANSYNLERERGALLQELRRNKYYFLSRLIYGLALITNFFGGNCTHKCASTIDHRPLAKSLHFLSRCL